MLTLDKFEEASEKVKEVTLETKLIYSNYLSEQTGNKVPEHIRYVEPIIKSALYPKKKERGD